VNNTASANENLTTKNLEDINSLLSIAPLVFITLSFVFMFVALFNFGSKSSYEEIPERVWVYPKKCPKCGYKFKKHTTKCPKCGKRIYGRKRKKGDTRNNSFYVIPIYVGGSSGGSSESSGGGSFGGGSSGGGGASGGF
jgi:uncharacterized membrane protein YgcG